jgi:hypothetical protein
MMPDVKYVSEYTHPFGMDYVQVEGFFKLTQDEQDHWFDPPPTPQRAAA